MSKSEQIVIIGKIGAPFGVKGWVKVHSFTDPATNILDYNQWLLKTDKFLDANHKTGSFSSKNQDQQGQLTLASYNNYFISEIKPHGKIFIAKLNGITDKDQAHLFTNLEIVVPRQSFDKLEGNEYYWTDLIGMQVYNDQDQLLGKVKELFSAGASDILVVTSKGKKDLLIPFVLKKHILSVDIEAKKIVVSFEYYED